jgi:hypothetical protein
LIFSHVGCAGAVRGIGQGMCTRACAGTSLAWPDAA